LKTYSPYSHGGSAGFSPNMVDEGDDGVGKGGHFFIEGLEVGIGHCLPMMREAKDVSQ